MTRELVSPHILAVQLTHAAHLASLQAPDRYEEEVCRRLEQVGFGLSDWERDQVLKEARFHAADRRV